MKNKSVVSRLKLSALVFVTGSALGLTACSLTYSGNIEEAATEFLGDLASLVGESSLSEEDIEGAVSQIRQAAEDAGTEIGGVFEEARLVRVVDGDTIVVEIGSEEYKVRLLDVNTLESVAPEWYRVDNSEEGEYASAWVKDFLEDYTEVYLEADDVDDTDQYGRLLRYVWVDVPDEREDTEEISTKMLNGILVASEDLVSIGAVEIADYGNGPRYLDELTEIYEDTLDR